MKNYMTDTGKEFADALFSNLVDVVRNQNKDEIERKEREDAEEDQEFQHKHRD